jgi:hypothetical protein
MCPTRRRTLRLESVEKVIRLRTKHEIGWCDLWRSLEDVQHRRNRNSEFDRIVHRRGVFGMFINDEEISLGDEFTVTEQRYEEIPYAVRERIRCF